MMKLFVFFLFIEILTCWADEVPQLRIIGGGQAEPGEFPSLAQLWSSGQYIRCLGSVVSTTWVATSAICCDLG